MIWGHDLPVNPKGALHLAVHRLRRWLEGNSGGSVVLSTGPEGYRLGLLAGTTTDLAEFRALAAKSDDVTALARALALWRGRPFANVPEDRLDTELVEILLAERRMVICRYAKSEFESGRLQSAESLLRTACRADPLDEEVHALLIESLAGMGQTATAMSVYDRIRQRLSADLGITPGSRLRLAHQRALTQPLITVRSKERPDPTSLVGRGEAMEALTNELRGTKVVTITGPPGVGKSALALEAARGAAHRLECLLTVVDLTDKGVHQPGAFPDLHVLLLDGCDGQIAETKKLIHMLTAASPGLVVIATALGRLGLQGEVSVPLAPLSAEDAEKLLVRQAATYLPNGYTDRKWIDPVLAHTGGLPSAIEISASLLKTLAPKNLIDVLSRDARVLLDGMDASGVSLAHRILRAFRSLGEKERHLLARLARLPGEFSLADAESLCAAPPLVESQVVRGLIALVDKALVQPVDDPEGRHYHLLKPIRVIATDLTEYTAYPPINTSLRECARTRPLESPSPKC